MHPSQRMMVSSTKLLNWKRLDIAFALIDLELGSRNEGLRSEIRGVLRAAGDLASSSVCEGNVGGDSKHELFLDSVGAPLVGAQRISKLIYDGQCVETRSTEMESPNYSFDYYSRLSVPEWLLEMAVCRFAALAHDLHVAFLWPSGRRYWSESVSLIGNVVYDRELELTASGAYALLYNCYRHMSWIGGRANRFRGLRQKHFECFPDEEFSVRVVLFQQPDGLDAVRRIKAAIRELSGIGFSSVHMTDSEDEVKSIADLVFSEVGRKFLNHTKDPRITSRVRLEGLGNLLAKRGADKTDIVIGGSFPLEVYGLRRARDMDILVGGFDAARLLADLPQHDDATENYGRPKIDLLYDPRLHFRVEGMKVLSLDMVLSLKSNRREPKDMRDIALIRSLCDPHIGRKRRCSTIFRKLRYGMLRFELMFAACIIAALRTTGTYNTVRSIVKAVRRLSRQIR